MSVKKNNKNHTKSKNCNNIIYDNLTLRIIQQCNRYRLGNRFKIEFETKSNPSEIESKSLCRTKSKRNRNRKFKTRESKGQQNRNMFRKIFQKFLKDFFYGGSSLTTAQLFCDPTLLSLNSVTKC